MAHARRKLFEAHKLNGSQIAGHAVTLIARLYEIEREARDLDPAARLLLRQQLARPAADALHAWLSEQRQRATSAACVPCHSDGCSTSDPQLLLLLDEPAAGLTAPDIKELVAIIAKIKAHGITLILIEHHMDVVMSICDTVSVLDFGQKIAEGAPTAVRSDPKVIEAYLGGDTV